VANVKQINFPIKKVGDVEIEDALQLTPIDQQNIADRMLALAEKEGVPLNETTGSAIYNEVMQGVVLEKLPALFTLFGEKIRAKADMAAKLRYTNASFDPNNPDKNKQPDLDKQIPEGGTTRQGAAEQAAAGMGIKLR
jgi:hypothetical protein